MRELKTTIIFQNYHFRPQSTSIYCHAINRAILVITFTDEKEQSIFAKTLEELIHIQEFNLHPDYTTRTIKLC